jgi:methylase of polypeptide subunit release factors
LGWRPVIEQPALLRHVLVAAALSARDRAVAPLNRGLDLGGKQVAEVGTGTGILALAAARAGATTVVAIDINPNAVRAVVADLEHLKLPGDGLNNIESSISSSARAGHASTAPPRPG